MHTLFGTHGVYLLKIGGDHSGYDLSYHYDVVHTTAGAANSIRYPVARAAAKYIAKTGKRKDLRRFEHSFCRK